MDNVVEEGPLVEPGLDAFKAKSWLKLVGEAVLSALVLLAIYGVLAYSATSGNAICFRGNCTVVPKSNLPFITLGLVALFVFAFLTSIPGHISNKHCIYFSTERVANAYGFKRLLRVESVQTSGQVQAGSAKVSLEQAQKAEFSSFRIDKSALPLSYKVLVDISPSWGNDKRTVQCRWYTVDFEAEGARMHPGEQGRFRQASPSYSKLFDRLTLS